MAEYRIEWRKNAGCLSGKPTVVDGPGPDTVGCVLWHNVVVGMITKSHGGKWRFRLRTFGSDFGETLDFNNPGLNVTRAVRAGDDRVLAKLASHLPTVPEDAIVNEQVRRENFKLLHGQVDPDWLKLN